MPRRHVPPPSTEDAHERSPRQHEPTRQPHEGPIKTPKQLVDGGGRRRSWCRSSLIVLLANYVGFGDQARRPAATGLGERGRGAAPAAGGHASRCATPCRRGALRTGEQVYTGAVRRLPRRRASPARPSSATTAAWAPRIADRLRGAAELGAQGQGRDGARRAAASTSDVRDRPRRRLPGQPGAAASSPSPRRPRPPRSAASAAN
ncbi:MAG: hypothetical protein MZW92_19380 [Comamonadaceae bacterium]|nr:hypothetical protein [Comamonadaceae bacterium]